MNCTDAIKILDRMIFEEIPADAGLMQHLSTCSSCSQAYTDALKAREVMNLLRRSEPLLRNPAELTVSIIEGLQKNPEKTFVVPLLLSRLLAAASVALFLAFGYEQYGIVQKISALEKQCAAIKSDSRYSDLLQQASTMNISEAGISFSELERLLSTEKGRNPLSVFIIKKRLHQKDKK
jgi:hypothetical protein